MLTQNAILMQDVITLWLRRHNTKSFGPATSPTSHTFLKVSEASPSAYFAGSGLKYLSLSYSSIVMTSQVKFSSGEFRTKQV